MTERENLDFGQALVYLKGGRTVRRAAFDEGVGLVLVPGKPPLDVPYPWIAWCGSAGPVAVYKPSTVDVLATDWQWMITEETP